MKQGGDLEKFRVGITRDVLSPAEYPKYGRWGGVDTASEEEQRKVIDSDWAQYERWLEG